jgi:hypothetical protein
VGVRRRLTYLTNLRRPNANRPQQGSIKDKSARKSTLKRVHSVRTNVDGDIHSNFHLIVLLSNFHGSDQTRQIELLLFLISGISPLPNATLISCVTDQRSSDCFFANDREFVLSSAGFIWFNILEVKQSYYETTLASPRLFPFSPLT